MRALSKTGLIHGTRPRAACGHRAATSINLFCKLTFHSPDPRRVIVVLVQNFSPTCAVLASDYLINEKSFFLNYKMGRKRKNTIYAYYNYNNETNKSKCQIEGCQQEIRVST